jgi:rhodanese-related sulfurtransferase
VLLRLKIINFKELAMEIKVGYKELVKRAEEQIVTISVAEALQLFGADDVVFIDLRDIRELYREGKIPGAKHVPRGMLEFWIDPESPYHHAIFAEDKEFVFFCNLGWRSALAADIAQQMGLKTCHIDGGFEAWKAFGGEVAQGKK